MESLITETDNNVVKIMGLSASEVSSLGVESAICKMLGLDKTVSDVFFKVMLVFMDHGVNPPSTVSTRLASSCGCNLASSISVGLSVMSGENHGGSIPKIADWLTSAQVPSGRIAGIGHPMHTDDPRVKFLLSTTQNGKYTEKLLSVANKIGVKPNIAGTSVALLLDAGLDKNLCMAPFVLGRCIGLSAHWNEQSKQPQKTIGYDGKKFLI